MELAPLLIVLLLVGLLGLGVFGWVRGGRVHSCHTPKSPAERSAKRKRST